METSQIIEDESIRGAYCIISNQKHQSFFVRTRKLFALKNLQADWTI